jgi:hypothetical protein
MALRDKELTVLRKTFKFDQISIFITIVSFKVIVIVICILVVVSSQSFNSALVFTIQLIINNIYFIQIAKDANFIKEASLAFSNI